MKAVVLTYRVIIFLSFSALSGMAQNGPNLVRNGSFEELQPNFLGDTLCPSNGGAIGLSKHWSSAMGACDYFNACSNSTWPSFGVPQNRMGNQSAPSGDAYALFGCYSTHWADAREYLWQELPQVLRGGQGYTLTFKISLADSVNFAVSSIGGLLSKDDTRDWQKDDFFEAEPQVETDPLILLDDKEGWMTVSGSFVAAGDEKYLTIGSFRRDDEMIVERVSEHPEASYNWETNGYYIDVIELYEDNSIGIDASPLMSSNVYPNPVSDGWVTLEYSLASGRELRLLMTDMLGRTVRDMTLHALHAQQDIDVTMLGKGMFVLNLIVDGRVVLKEQVVVQ